MISFQLLLIWNLLLILTLQLNHYTNASFNDIEEVAGFISICSDFEGTDKFCEPLGWDNSSLKLINNGVTVACINEAYTFTLRYKNDGENMTHSIWDWELFKVEGSGQNATPVGDSLAVGIVPKVMKNKDGKVEVTLNNVENGQYKFKIWRPIGHGGNNSGGNNQENERSFIWSDSVKLNFTCTTGTEEGIETTEAVTIDISEPNNTVENIVSDESASQSVEDNSKSSEDTFFEVDDVPEDETIDEENQGSED